MCDYILLTMRGLEVKSLGFGLKSDPKFQSRLPWVLTVQSQGRHLTSLCLIFLN